jgi:hypothetical protein
MPSMCVPNLGQEIKFETHVEQRAKYSKLSNK